MSNTTDIQAIGERVEALLAEFASASDPAIAGRAEELVGLLVDFYGAGLARIMELLDKQAAAPLLADKAVAGLLVLHDLHPQSTEERVLAALDRVRPYLGSHAGDVEYLGLDDDGTVRLRLAGSCDGCPSSALTVKMAIEKGIEDVAPEVTKVEVEGMVPESASGLSAPEGRTLLPLAQVSKQPETPASTWVEIDGIENIGQGQVVPKLVADTAAVVCNVAGSLYAYADRCPACGSGLAGGKLAGALLTCPGCTQRYDVVRAGRGWSDASQASSTAEAHLDPLPLLTENGGVRIAVPAQAVS
ncbi:MAG TPA: NifU family protein [Pseudonocardiaceae bacterium]|nr:NifU family protein [Pseudonocardiaceae bacterium]